MMALRAIAAALADATTSAAALVDRALAPDEFGATERLLDTARSEARAADARRTAGVSRGPFDGVPIAVKSNIDVAEVPTTSGTALSLTAARADAAVVAALRAAGLIVARTATMAELAIGSITDNAHTGVCRNPLDPERNAGGSSGGSAALVAAGMVPAALGSDTMGSIRIPASYCGVAAWKPARDTVPTEGLVPLHPFLDTVGLIARTSDELALLAPILAPTITVGTPPNTLRIGAPDIAAMADRAGRRCGQAALDALRTVGYTVSDVALGVEPAVLRRRGLLLCEAHTYRTFATAVDTDDPGISPRVRDLLRYGRDADAARVRAAEADLSDAGDRIRALFDDIDVLVLPVTPTGPPGLHEEPEHAADLTAWVNVAGLPAVVFPVVAGGISRGVQIVGPPDGDALTLTLAAALEGLVGRGEPVISR